MKRLLGVLVLAGLVGCGTDDGGTDPDDTGFSRDRPANFGQELEVEFEGLDGRFVARIAPLEQIRGEEAYRILLDANQFNDPPPAGLEYMLIRVRFHIEEAPSSATSHNLHGFDFSTVSGAGVVHPNAFGIVDPEPVLAAELFEGATHEGWAAWYVQVGDQRPLLRFDWETPEGLNAWWRMYQ